MVSILKESKIHWRFAAMALNFLELIVSEEQPIPIELTEYVVKSVNSEHPAIRRICLALLTRILIILKKRASVAGTNQIDHLKMQVDLRNLNVPEFTVAYTNCALNGTSGTPQSVTYVFNTS